MSTFDDLARARAANRMTPPCDSEVQDKCPSLWSFIAKEYPDPDIPRIPPTITINVVDGGYSIAFQEHDLGRQKVFTIDRLADLVEALERALASDLAVKWRDYQSPRNRLGLKKFEKKAGQGTVQMRPWEDKGGGRAKK